MAACMSRSLRQDDDNSPYFSKSTHKNELTSCPLNIAMPTLYVTLESWPLILIRTEGRKIENVKIPHSYCNQTAGNINSYPAVDTLGSCEKKTLRDTQPSSKPLSSPICRSKTYEWSLRCFITTTVMQQWQKSTVTAASITILMWSLPSLLLLLTNAVSFTE